MKAVVFDYDGTLTYKSPNSWKAIWNYLGYSTDKDSYFAKLYGMFMNKEISHQKWCDLTCDAFIEKRMNFDAIREVIKLTNLIKGFDEFINTLKTNGYSLHIVSGSINHVIIGTLKEKIRNFDSINANNMSFNNEFLEKIEGTKYDFEGKAVFIEKLKQKGFESKNIIFVGNSHNDEWVCNSGCRTICLNPKYTNADDKNIWHNTVISEDIRDVLPFILENRNYKIKEIQKEK